MTRFEVFIDWLDTGYMHRSARPGDAENLFGTVPILWNGGMKRSTGFSVTAVTGYFETADYGVATTWQTSASGTSSQLSIGADQFLSEFDLKAQPAGDYTGVVWVRTESADVSVHLRLRTLHGDDEAGSTVALTAGQWTRLTATASLSAPVVPYLRLQRDGPASGSRDVLVAGPMIVAGSTAPDGYNSGGLSRYDNITDMVMAAGWNNGFQQAYRHVSDIGRGTFTLRDPEAWFAPENAASPLYGALLPRKQMRVYADDDPALASRTLLWHGYTQRYAPSPLAGMVGTCKIDCIDLRGLAEGLTARLLYRDLPAKDIAEAAANSVGLPAAGGKLFAVAPPPAAPTPTVPDEAIEIYPFAPDAAQRDDMDVVRLLSDCAGAEQAKIAFDARDIHYRTAWRYVNQLGGTAQIVLDESRLQSAEYVYGESLVNESTVVARKRKASAAADKVLYDLDEPLTLAAKETRRLRVRYKDRNLEDDKTVGGIDVYLEYDAPAAVTATIVEEFSTGCEIELVNSRGADKTVSALQVKGVKVTSWGESEHRAVQADSRSAYGTRAELLDFRLPADRERAQRLADYRVARFGEPQGEIRRVTLKTLHGDDDLRAAMLSFGLFTPIRIEAPRIGHAADYVIIGEEHRLDAGTGGQQDGTIGGYTVSWVVEKQHPFFVLDDPVRGLLDGSNRLAFY